MDAITTLDQSVLEALYAVRDLNTSYVLIGITELGSVATIIGLTAIAVLVLMLARKFSYATGLAISVALSGIGIFLAKGLIERARPDEFYQAYVETWYSFPSAHAALATALYGFLTILFWRMFPRFRIAIGCAGILLIGAISFSRLYLGVHFLSDVVVGILLGAACVWLGLLFASKVKV